MALQKGMGRRPSLFIDKLGERLAFERSGTRLYEALLVKFEADGSLAEIVSEERLRAIRDDEARHFHMVWQALERLGADPTVQTPCADAGGVESQGLFQLLSDPRSSFAQGLHAALTAELVDNEGWSMLIDLADKMKQPEMAEEFRKALREEEVHLQLVRDWLREANLKEAGAART
jgi:rubrerythrin